MPEWLTSVSKDVGSFLYYIAPTVVGVLLGGVIVERYWNRKSTEAAIIDYISKELDDLVEKTLLYWSIDCTGTSLKADADRKQAAQLAAKIRGASHNLNVVLRSYSNKYCKHIDYQGLWSEVHDACTGGDFEVAKHQADPHRYARVVNTTHRVRWQLLERRI